MLMAKWVQSRVGYVARNLGMESHKVGENAQAEFACRSEIGSGVSALKVVCVLLLHYLHLLLLLILLLLRMLFVTTHT
jgi:hypothetical protein